MKKFKETAEKAFNFLEVYIPMITFFVMFICFVIVIVYRYVLHASMQWVNELSTLTFVFACAFAASYGSRAGEHVVFSVLYDRLSEKLKLACRIVGNLIVVVLFVILFPSAVEAVGNVFIRKTPVMKLSYSYLFSPFLLFIVLTVIHHTVLLVKDFKNIINKLKRKAN